jgi:hypothetical protein
LLYIFLIFSFNRIKDEWFKKLSFYKWISFWGTSR